MSVSTGRVILRIYHRYSELPLELNSVVSHRHGNKMLIERDGNFSKEKDKAQRIWL